MILMLQVLCCRFDVVGKFETLTTDIEYIRSQVGLQIGGEDFPWTNKKGSVTEVSQKYFQEIDRESIRKLYQIYQIDFEMFQYSSKEYFV